MNKEKINQIRQNLKDGLYDETRSDYGIQFYDDLIEALLEEPNAVDVTPPVKPVKWRATIDGTYYYIDNVGEIDSECDSYDCWDDHRYLTGNYYKNEKEAEQALEVEKAKGRLDHAYYGLVGDWKPDWSNFKQEKFSFYYFVEKFDVYSTTLDYHFGSYYFDDIEKVSQFIKENESDLKLVFNIQDSND